MVLNSLFPVFSLMLLGRILRFYRLMSNDFIKSADSLVYYIFFPALLFWKIGTAPPVSSIDRGLCLAAICSVGAIFLISTFYILASGMDRFKVGAFSQSCYRFNSYLGMAVIMTALGDEGVSYFGVMVGFVIPIINVLAVSVLIWFSGESYSIKDKLFVTIKSIVLNPLIFACIAGILFSWAGLKLPVFIDNTLYLFSIPALPLALISIGGQLTLIGIKNSLSLSIIAACFKLILLPVIGYLFLNFFSVTGLPYKVGMIFFVLPTSTATYVLSAQLSSDTHLATSAIVLSTVLSFVSLSMVLLL